MSNITKFRHPDKKPTDPLLAKDPIPNHFNLNSDARLIYLRIVKESEPGVLLQCDRLVVELAAMSTAQSLSKTGIAEGELECLEEIYNGLMLPELGQEYISQILRKG